MERQLRDSNSNIKKNIQRKNKEETDMERPEIEVTKQGEDTKRMLSYMETLNKARKEKETKEEA